MTAESIERIHIEQATWCEGSRNSPLWLRLLGGRKTYYADRGSYLLPWGELSLKLCSFGLSVGGYETAHLNIAVVVAQVFVRLPWLDRVICGGDNAIESPRFGFSIHGPELGGIHLNWGRHTKVINYPWQPWYGIREFLSHDGSWLPTDERARSWSPGEGVEAVKLEAPYHYLLDSGEVQHVTATVTRERVWPAWCWFGTSGRVRKAPVSDALRRLQRRFAQPKQYIDIEFSEGIGDRAGSWKGGCTGCSYEMSPGETPQHTLRRMQRERRFR